MGNDYACLKPSRVQSKLITKVNLGIVFEKNSVPSELSSKEQVIAGYSVKEETPKEHNKANLSWKEEFKSIVHNHNGLKTGKNYQAQVDLELRIAP